MQLVFLLLSLTVDSAPPIQIQPADDPRKVEVVAVLPEKLAAQIPAGNLGQEEGEKWLRFALVDTKNNQAGPPIFGKYERQGNKLIFQPRFLLNHEQTYRATLTGADQPANVEYVVPARKPTPPAVVNKIYPTAETLPANNLKFYIYFSEPMRGGEDIFEQIYLLDDKGNKIEQAWLLEELWDETQQRLLVFIHPGRIKWGLLLRRLLGPVLVPDRQYTLVISKEMLDRNGQSLGKDYKYTFRTSEEYRRRVDLSQWKLDTPAAGTVEPVRVTSSLPLDHGSVKRYIQIVDASGKTVEGRMEIGEQEKSWMFHPRQPWQQAEYKVSVHGEFEDVAGNTPRLPFDVDLKETQPPPQPLTLSFRPAAAQSH